MAWSWCTEASTVRPWCPRTGGDHPDTARSTGRYWRIHAWQPRYQGCEKPARLGHLQCRDRPPPSVDHEVLRPPLQRVHDPFIARLGMDNQKAVAPFSIATLAREPVGAR
jgi:hypothetical protein